MKIIDLDGDAFKNFFEGMPAMQKMTIIAALMSDLASQAKKIQEAADKLKKIADEI